MLNCSLLANRSRPTTPSTSFPYREYLARSMTMTRSALATIGPTLNSGISVHSTGMRRSKLITFPELRGNRNLSATFASITLLVAPVSKMNLITPRFPICPFTTTKNPETNSNGIVRLTLEPTTSWARVGEEEIIPRTAMVLPAMRIQRRISHPSAAVAAWCKGRAGELVPQCTQLLLLVLTLLTSNDLITQLVRFSCLRHAIASRRQIVKGVTCEVLNVSVSSRFQDSIRGLRVGYAIRRASQSGHSD